MEDNRVPFVHKTHTRKKSCHSLFIIHLSFLPYRKTGPTKWAKRKYYGQCSKNQNKNQLSEHDVGFIRANKPDIE